mmetsp:Transcript_54230/g.126697  ORF Transcript_54230/g.126697 Transcript_54230/m.126697 type:complete len:230 (+) Transcript_54230:103-792(+)
MSASNMPPVSEIRLSVSLSFDSDVFPSRASTMASAPSSPSLQDASSSVRSERFWDSTPAMLTATSSPSGFSDRRSVVRVLLVQRVSAHASPPYSEILLLVQLQLVSPRFPSIAFATAMQPRSCMCVCERSRCRNVAFVTMHAARLETPLGPSLLRASERLLSVRFTLRPCPATTPTSAPAPLFDRSRSVTLEFSARPCRISTQPAVPSALVPRRRVLSVWLSFNILLSS